jgi:single-strand DNA-binding protein
MSLNQVTLCGNLTRDPETRFTGGGNAVVKASLALNEKWQAKDGESKERTTFVDVTLFGKTAEAFAKYHTKGSLALIVGKLNQEEWTDKATGEQRKKLAVIGDRWEFVGGKRDAPASKPEFQPEASQWPKQSAPMQGGLVDDTPF